MKINKIIFPVAALSLAFAACDDQVMEWRDGDPTVTGSDIPMELKEKIANYDFIKNYMAEYHPGVDITLGMGLDNFLDDEAYRQVVLDNYQGVTFGNAMKHQSVVSASGKFNWDKVDQFIAMDTGLKLHGHNLLWHTQQQQSYMKSLIAPKLVQEQTSGGDGISNLLVGDANDFEGGTTGGWGSWGSNKESVEVVAGAGVDGSAGLVLTNKGDGNAWEAQLAYTFDAPFEVGVPYIIQFQAKSNSAAGSLQFQYQRGADSGQQGGYNDFAVGTDWFTCEYEFTIPEEKEGADRLVINFGKVGASYTLDNIKFGKKIDSAKAPRRAAAYHYELKTPEEKKAILLGAMEEWIKEAMTHAGSACSSWDVINEPIGDNCRIRGIEGGWSGDDSEPVETTESGLSLNWANEAGNGHFYWGYYCGMDYAVKAFEYAAKYNPNGAKLFVNDYNLESNPNKLAKLIEFVEYIDNNGAHVDGIGTQMHVSSSISKEQVDAMFKTLAATDKLVRITELDITVGTKTPSADQLQKQADCYQMILTSYFENIPENQQSAITLWTLSDNEKEHEYWLKDDAPNIFDASYGRKLAYKGVCDAIAGKDVSADFRSHDYSKK